MTYTRASLGSILEHQLWTSGREPATPQESRGLFSNQAVLNTNPCIWNPCLCTEEGDFCDDRAGGPLPRRPPGSPRDGCERAGEHMEICHYDSIVVPHKSGPVALWLILLWRRPCVSLSQQHSLLMTALVREAFVCLACALMQTDPCLVLHQEFSEVGIIKGSCMAHHHEFPSW